MELNVLEESKNKIIVEIKGQSHTICNALNRELWNDKSVKAAGYNVKHPVASSPVLIVETDGKNPRDALADAAKRLGKSSEKFIKSFDKEIK